MIVELKWDKSAVGAIGQMKDKKYVQALDKQAEDILLVGINYNRKTRKHECVIEKYHEE